jgi:2-polyprenyl-3-methyl-5-hydroxy-6-metoxy-1,4-benzoquinol methylase/copper chaperone CopZ
MRQLIKVEKAQCCVFNNHINREIASLNGVYGVNVNNYKNEITIDHTTEVSFEMIAQKLEENGYKVIDEVENLNSTEKIEQPEINDPFAVKAKEWDTPMKVKMAEKFVYEMHQNIKFSKELKVLDFGCGTGLVGLLIAPLVKNVVLMDTSTSMIEVLKSKLENVKAENVKVINSEIFAYTQKDIDIVFSLMAMHHIENLNETIDHITKVLKPGGILVIGDLKEEDGTFHPEESVAHNGFNISQLSDIIEGSDMEVTKANVYNTITKNDKEYEQFILIAQKSNEPTEE